MARIRTIKPKFWDDVKIGRLTRDARLLYIGLWTFADDLGVVIADAVWLKSKIFPYDQLQIKQVEAWLRMLEETGFICHVTVRSETFIYLPTFSRHQVINRPNMEDINIPKDLLDKALKEIGARSLINHGTITEQSVPIKGEDEDKDNNPPIIPPRGDEREGDDSDIPQEDSTSGSSDKSTSTPTPELRGTPSRDFVKFQEWIKNNAPRVAKMKEPFTEVQFSALKRDFDSNFICNLLQAMHNHEPLLKKNRSANLTFRNWAKRRQSTTMHTDRSKHAIAAFDAGKRFEKF